MVARMYWQYVAFRAKIRLLQPSPALLMDQYHFLADEFSTNSPFVPAAAGTQLFAWFAHIGEPVERYGSRRGKIVKFSQRNDEKVLFAPDADSIALFSPRIVPPDEADEVRNCDALAVHRPAVTLLLAMRASQLPLPQQFDGAAGIPGLLGSHIDN